MIQRIRPAIPRGVGNPISKKLPPSSPLVMTTTVISAMRVKEPSPKRMDAAIPFVILMGGTIRI